MPRYRHLRSVYSSPVRTTRLRLLLLAASLAVASYVCLSSGGGERAEMVPQRDAVDPSLRLRDPSERVALVSQPDHGARSVVVVEPDGSVASAAVAVSLDGTRVPQGFDRLPLSPLSGGLLILPEGRGFIIRSENGTAHFEPSSGLRRVHLHPPASLTLRLGDCPRPRVNAVAEIRGLQFATSVDVEGTTIAVPAGSCVVRGEPIGDALSVARIVTSPRGRFSVFLHYEDALRISIRVEDSAGRLVRNQRVDIRVNGQAASPVVTDATGHAEVDVPSGVHLEFAAQRVEPHPSFLTESVLATEDREVVLVMREASVLSIDADFDSANHSDARVDVRLVRKAGFDGRQWTSPAAEVTLSPLDPSIQVAVPRGEYVLVSSPTNAVVLQSEMHLSIDSGASRATVHARAAGERVHVRIGALPTPWKWQWSYREPGHGAVGSGDLSSGEAWILRPAGTEPVQVRIVGTYLEWRTLAGWFLLGRNTAGELDLRARVQPCKLRDPVIHEVTSAWLYRSPMGKRPVSLSLVHWLPGYSDPITIAQQPLVAIFESAERKCASVVARRDSEGLDFYVVDNMKSPQHAPTTKISIAIEGVPPISGRAMFEWTDGRVSEVPFNSQGRIAQGLPGKPASCSIVQLGGLVVRSDVQLINTLGETEKPLVARFRLRLEPLAAWPEELGMDEALDMRLADGRSAVPNMLAALSASTQGHAPDRLVRLVDAAGNESTSIPLRRLLPMTLLLDGIGIALDPAGR